MLSPLTIRPFAATGIPTVTDWAQQEGFAPAAGDVAIYRKIDRQGLWVSWPDQEPVGCIAGVRYNATHLVLAGGKRHPTRGGCGLPGHGAAGDCH